MFARMFGKPVAAGVVSKQTTVDTLSTLEQQHEARGRTRS
jgi:hypothetical protein